MDQVSRLEASSGGSTTCAIRGSEATLWCWGYNHVSAGRMDDPIELDLVPTQVAGLSGVADVAVGTTHTCVLLADGRLECWGRNYWGQLGTGDMGAREVPTEIDLP